MHKLGFYICIIVYMYILCTIVHVLILVFRGMCCTTGMTRVPEWGEDTYRPTVYIQIDGLGSVKSFWTLLSRAPTKK